MKPNKETHKPATPPQASQRPERFVGIHRARDGWKTVAITIQGGAELKREELHGSDAFYLALERAVRDLEDVVTSD